MKHKNERIYEIMAERNCCYSAARYHFLKEEGLTPKRNYVMKDLTKDRLIELGVTNVTEDGKHVYINNVEAKLVPPTGNKGETCYWHVNGLPYTLHRVVYVWFNNIQPAGLTIDHKDNDKNNCALSNLQLLTRGENVNKSENWLKTSSKYARNQYTYTMTDDEIEYLREQKHIKAVDIAERKSERAKQKEIERIKQEEYSKLVKERANKIRELNEAIKETHKAYIETNSYADRRAWKLAIQEKKLYLVSNSKNKLMESKKN